MATHCMKVLYLNSFKLNVCKGDADISTKHELTTEQDSARGHSQSRAANDCSGAGSQSATDTGTNVIAVIFPVQ